MKRAIQIEGPQPPAARSGLEALAGFIALGTLVCACLVLLGELARQAAYPPQLQVWGWALLLGAFSLLVQVPRKSLRTVGTIRKILGAGSALLLGCVGPLLLPIGQRGDVVAVVLLALALGTITWETAQGHRPSQFVVMVVALICLGELVSLIAGPGIQSLAGLGLAAGRLAVLALAIGTAFARPHSGIMAAVIRDTVGGSVLRRFLPLIVAAPVLMAMLVGSGERAHWYGPGRDEALLAIAGILIAWPIVWLQSKHIDAALARQKSLEDRVRNAEKMESVGVLAAGVAHDFNNLLVGIIGFADLLRRDLDQQDPRQHLIDEIVSAADSAASLTQQLLAFSRKQMLAPQVISLNQIVTDNEMLMRSVLGPDIHLELALARALPPSRVDPQQMQRVLINLIMNARDAMPNGGRLVIETAQVPASDSSLPAHAGLPGGTYVLVAVDDTGSGVLPKDQARIFEPFYTTKDVGKGTGLGLSTVYGIVTQSGGQVFLTPKSSPGARFEIYLPAVAEASMSPVGPGPASTSLPARATILVVEDNEIVQRAIRETLAVMGYELLIANAAEPAIQMSLAHPGAIDLLLADVVLPGASGTTVARELCRQRPDLRVLFMSGYHEDETLRAQLCKGRVAFLKKPFRPSQLMTAVRQVLSAPAAAEWPAPVNGQ